MGELAQLKEALPPIQTGETSIFSDLQKFKEVQEMAQFLCQSDLVPQQFKGNAANCLIALEMSNRLKADPLMIMQNLYIVHGKPAWSSQFLISCINTCGRFSALQYEFFGTEGQDDWGCYAYAKELSTGQTVKGPSVSIAMAKAEGWHGKNGSKWKTLPQLMLTYRAATFFTRTIAPEVSMGMYTAEEAKDMGPATVVYDNEPNPEPEDKFYPAADFAENFPKWQGIVQSGKRSVDDIIAMVESKGKLTDKQAEKIRGIK